MSASSENDANLKNRLPGGLESLVASRKGWYSAAYTNTAMRSTIQVILGSASDLYGLHCTLIQSLCEIACYGYCLPLAVAADRRPD